MKKLTLNQTASSAPKLSIPASYAVAFALRDNLNVEALLSVIDAEMNRAFNEGLNMGLEVGLNEGLKALNKQHEAALEIINDSIQTVRQLREKVSQ